MQQTEQIHGTIERVRYTHGATGFSSFRLRCAETGASVHAVGPLERPAEGETVYLQGNYTRHSEYARVFAFHAFHAAPPATPQARVQFLIDHARLTPSAARAAEERFGADTLALLLNRPRALTQIEGIDARTAHAAARRYHAIQRDQHLTQMLEHHGLDPELLGRASARGADNDPNREIAAHPYRLALLFDDAPFARVHRLARALDCGGDPERWAAAMADTLRRHCASGHNLIRRETLVEGSTRRLGETPDASTIDGALEQLAGQRIVRPHEGALVLPSAREAQARLDAALDRLLIGEATYDLAPHRVLPPELPRGWREALIAVLRQKVVAVDLPRARAAKLVALLAEIAAAVPLELVVLAVEPGLRATLAGAGLNVTIAHPATWIGYDRSNPPRVGPSDPHGTDLLVVADADRLDVALTAYLLDAVAGDTSVVLAGDRAMPAPVGFAAGQAFVDLLNSDTLTHASLRGEAAGEDSPHLVQLLDALGRAQPPVLPEARNHPSLKRYERPRTALAGFLAHLVGEILPRARADDTPAAVFAALGLDELAALNETLQQAWNGNGRPIADTALRIGDPVHAPRAISESGEAGYVALEAFERAFVEGVARHGHEVVLRCPDGRRVTLDKPSARTLRLDYARRPGRSPGTRMPCAILAVPDDRSAALHRAAFYQAAHVATRDLVLVGAYETFARAAMTDPPARETLAQAPTPETA